MPLKSTAPMVKTDSPVNNAALQMIALIPTQHLYKVVEEGFFKKLKDEDFMRIAVFLEKKGYDEGGCAIGSLIIDNETRMILGKGHNRHIQENRVYWHGETDAINDAGTRTDFSKASLFTTLTPCSVCTALTFSQGFNRVVIGNRLAGINQENEDLLRAKGVQVDILEDQEGIDLYKEYAKNNPVQNIRDWQGQAGVVRAHLDDCGPHCSH